MSDKQTIENQVLKETLSALLDGEAGKVDALELRRLAKSLQQDSQLIAGYQRYTAVSAAMRDQVIGSDDFLDKVRCQIDQENEASLVTFDNHKPNKPSAFRAVFKMAGQAALAASVAVIAVFVVQNNPDRRLPIVPTVAEAVTEVAPSLGDHISRVLNPQVLFVSAGNYHVSTPVFSLPEAREADCVINEGAPLASGMRELQLPAGFVLCRMEENQQRCRAVSSTIACHLE